MPRIIVVVSVSAPLLPLAPRSLSTIKAIAVVAVVWAEGSADGTNGSAAEMVVEAQAAAGTGAGDRTESGSGGVIGKVRGVVRAMVRAPVRCENGAKRSGHWHFRNFTDSARSVEHRRMCFHKRIDTAAAAKAGMKRARRRTRKLHG